MIILILHLILLNYLLLDIIQKTIDYINHLIYYLIFMLPLKSIDIHITLNKNIIIQLYISKDYVYLNLRLIIHSI